MANKRIKFTNDANTDFDTSDEEHGPLRKDKRRMYISMDIVDTDSANNSLTSSSRYSKRQTFKRRGSRRTCSQEPQCGHDYESYEKIRERILQERAVTNAIDALQERWKMIMFMYNDCVELNELRKKRKLRNNCILRQFELIFVVSLFILLCLPLSFLLCFIK